MSSSRVQFVTMTNLDDTEEIERKDEEQVMEDQIRSSGSGAFDRSDIMYLLEKKNGQKTAENIKKEQLEQELAKFRVNALNKKPTTVIATKEKRTISQPPAVIIKKKKQKINRDLDSTVTAESGTNESVEYKEKKSKDELCHESITKPRTEKPALAGLLADYTDSD